MKALVCNRCGDIRALNPTGEWVDCNCATVRARWVDPAAGTAEFQEAEMGAAYVLGLNNQYLVPALSGVADFWENSRKLHDLATNAPHHVFDKSRASCWAVIMRPGRSNDVTLSKYDKRREFEEELSKSEEELDVEEIKKHLNEKFVGSIVDSQGRLPVEIKAYCDSIGVETGLIQPLKNRDGAWHVLVEIKAKPGEVQLISIGPDS